MGVTKRGFTIVEVMIFLAISGLLLAVALLTIGNAVNNARFNDSVDATLTMMQRAYDDVAVGRSAQANGTSCLGDQAGASGYTLLGRALRFQHDTDTVAIYYLVAPNASLDTSTAKPEWQRLSDSSPTVLEGGACNDLVTNYDIPWQSAYSQVGCGSGPCYLWLAMTRSTNGNQIMTYVDPDSSSASFDAAQVFTSANQSLNYNICLRDTASITARYRVIELTNSSGGRFIQLGDDVAAGACS